MINENDINLQPTELIDYNHPNIREIINQFEEEHITPREKAIAVFYLVRDKIQYFIFNDYEEKASETLIIRKGYCLTKTNLQIALLRGLGIPARYCFSRLSREIFRLFANDEIVNRLPAYFNMHPWCECQLDNRWISCDTLFDNELIEAIRQNGFITNREIPTIDWDGVNDTNVARYWIDNEHIKRTPSMDNLQKFNEKIRSIQPMVAERLESFERITPMINESILRLRIEYHHRKYYQ